jgi:hypothetical protein
MTASVEGVGQTCPNCGSPAMGKFCSDCGTTLGVSACAACSAELIDGARFCHRCGLPAGATAPATERKTTSAMSLPWIVAAISLLAFIALIAGQRFGANRPDAATEAGTTLPSDMARRAPDISQMTPAERAIRLHTRIMTLRQAGKQDSVMMFAPMAIAAFEMLGNLDADSRYDLGMIGEASENGPLAKAQADTILQQNPDHLLGLILAARAWKIAPPTKNGSTRGSSPRSRRSAPGASANTSRTNKTSP